MRYMQWRTRAPLYSHIKAVYNPQGRHPARYLAGSDLRPLTNIPHCCLPQEFGPCLSSNVGDLPLRTPTDRRLGGPLPRQQANQTHPHPLPENLCFISDAVNETHRVLGRLSTGYPQVRGRLDTRYSPVRRSTSRMCKHIMPFPHDLHVLSLQPAFILSQDQTLHCKISLMEREHEWHEGHRNPPSRNLPGTNYQLASSSCT